MAEKNRTASGAETVYADQKIGLLPEWASEDGRVTIVAEKQHPPDEPLTLDFDGCSLTVPSPRDAVRRLDAKIDKYQELIKCLRS